MERKTWRLCAGLMAVALAVHFVACRHDRPMVLLSLLASGVVLACLRRSAGSGNAARAGALALDPPDRSGAYADAATGVLPGHRSFTALVIVVLGGTCVAVTLGAAWVAYQARPGGTAVSQAREVRR